MDGAKCKNKALLVHCLVPRPSHCQDFDCYNICNQNLGAGRTGNEASSDTEKLMLDFKQVSSRYHERNHRNLKIRRQYSGPL